MDKKVNEQIERFTDKLMKETVLEKPSMDFTSQVMLKVNVLSQSEITTYKPLISKRMWTIISVIAVGALVYLFFYGTNKSSLLASFDLSILSDNKLSNAISSFKFSKTHGLCHWYIGLDDGYTSTIAKGVFK